MKPLDLLRKLLPRPSRTPQPLDLSTAELEAVLAARRAEAATRPLGDGRAVFLSDMTDDEYDRYVLEEKRGWKPFYQRLKDTFSPTPKP